MRPLNSRHNSGPALCRGVRNLYSDRLATWSANIPRPLRRKSSRIGPAAAAIRLHPGLRRATSVLVVRPATPVHDRARSYPACCQYHRQKNRPGAPHSGII